MVGAVIVLAIGWLGDGIFNLLWFGMPGTAYIPFPLLRVAAILVLLLGILAVAGGIYALRRKAWGLALTGSACGAVLAWFLGIPAVILIALSKKEFAELE